jgi:hypothetical protein
LTGTPETVKASRAHINFEDYETLIPQPAQTPRSMKSYLFKSLILALAIAAASPVTSHARTMLDIPGVPVSAFRSYLPAEAFQRLVNAPVKAYILVRGQVANNKVFGARVAHSEANHVFDKISIQMAQSMEVYSDVTFSRVPSTVLVHVLIYGLPDGSEDALAIAQNDAVGASSLVYSRSLMLQHLGLANKAPKAPAKPKK